MEPIPETRQVLEGLMRHGDVGAAARMVRLGREAKAVVPECVGLSLSLLEEGVTFTLVASSVEIAALDAMQYVESGPCVTSIDVGRPVESWPGDAATEEQWHLFSVASAAAGVRSTLTLPIEADDGQVVGAINLYAATPTAFEDHHDELAKVLGGSAQHAVRNADLDFRTRREAAEAPQRLEERYDVDLALALIAAEQDLTLDAARERLRAAAARAGITDAQAARAMRGLFGG